MSSRFIKIVLGFLIGTVIAMTGIDMVYSVYPATMRVSATGEDFMIFTHLLDDRITYHIATPPEDMMEGDIVSCVMYDRGGDGDIRNDRVLEWRCSAW